MVELKEPCHPGEEKPASPKLKMMDTMNPPTTETEELYCCNIAATIFPLLEEYYCTYAKHIVDSLRMKWESVPFSYDMIEQHSTILSLIHGLFLMLYGGTWLSLATFISFGVVYNVWDLILMLKTECKEADTDAVLKILKQLWLLALVGFTVWTVPFLSKLTVAFMLEKYVTYFFVNSAIMDRLEKKFPAVMVFGKWWPTVRKASVRLLLGILSVFAYNFQASLVMGCIGWNKVWTSITPRLRKQIQDIKGPFNLEGQVVTLWASVIVCTLWQLWHTYEFSFLGIIVPIGFLIRAKKLKAF